MPKGHYKRKTPEIDYRQILALLPGRLIVKQLIEREIAVIRASITEGVHREYLALLPGLEMEQQRIGEMLGSMTDMSRSDTPRKAEVISERRMLAAPGTANHTKVLNAATILTLPFQSDKPTSPLLILRELMEHGRLVRKAFIEKRGAERPTLKGSGFSSALAVLKRAGVRMRNGRGTITLLSKIEGKLPESAVSKAVGEGKPLRAGSQPDYLIRAFENNPDHIVDLKVAQKETGAVTYNSIQVALCLLRRQRNMKIIKLGQGRYQLVPKPAERKAR
jgi:hypothetical protein